MPYLTPRDPHVIAGLKDFGVAIRAARMRSAMSQRGLEFRSGVSQSVVSRAERALAPKLALDRVIEINLVLGQELPMGWCPHEHPCRWQPPVRREEQLRSGHLALLLRGRSDGD